MNTPNEFWLDLHRLSQSYEAEGLTPDERADNIIREFQMMPPTVQRHVLEDMAPLAHHLTDLHTLALAAANAKDKQRRLATNGGGNLSHFMS